MLENLSNTELIFGVVDPADVFTARWADGAFFFPGAEKARQTRREGFSGEDSPRSTVKQVGIILVLGNLLLLFFQVFFRLC